MTDDHSPEERAAQRRPGSDDPRGPQERRSLPGDGSGVTHRTRADRLAAQSGNGVGRAYGLTALGTLLPGAGLILTRRRLVGIPLLALAVGSGLGVLIYLIKNGAFRSALDLAARPDVLRTLGVTLVIGGLIWIGSGG